MAKRPPSTARRPQVRRDDRDDVQDHPLRLVAHVTRVPRVAERVDDLEPLEQHLLAMLRRLRQHLSAQLLGRLVDVQLLEELTDRGRADVGDERAIAFFLRLRLQVEVLVLVEQLTSSLPAPRSRRVAL